MSSALLSLNPDPSLPWLQTAPISQAQSRRAAAMKWAVLLSLVLHGVSYYWWGPPAEHPLAVSPVIRVTLNNPRPPQVVPVAVAPRPPAMHSPQTHEREVAPAPAVAPQRAVPRKRVRVQAAPIAPTAPSAIKTAPPEPPAPIAAAVTRQVATAAPGQLLESYLQRVFAQIERHKFYPGSARRIGLEGTVHVRFSLTATGDIEDLALLSGPKLLRNAAEQILRRALPLPVPPPGLDAPLRVEYQMPFKLY